MKLAVWSAAPRLGDVAANIDTVAKALGDGSDLVVFPELFLTGYNIGDDLQRLAFSEGDERLEPLRAACRQHKLHLIVGAPHIARAGVVYNAALCIDDEGNEMWVHKRALPTFTTFREGLFFAHGGRQPVWHTRHGGIGVHICYDLYFPEFQKRQIMDGADLVVNISASPSSASRRNFLMLLPARAIENAVFVAYANNVGSQDGIVFWGGSRVYGPRGVEVAAVPDFEEGVAHADIDFADLRAAREFRPTIRDSDVADLEAVEPEA